MKVLNYSLVLILVLLLGIGAYSIASSYLTRSTMVVVDSIKGGAACGPLKTGDRIISIESRMISSASDFVSASSSVKAGEYIAMVVNGGPGGCKAIADGDLGFTVKELTPRGIKHGADISSSKSYIYSLENPNSTNLEKTKKIIENRINFYDFLQTRVEIVGDKIKITTPYEDDLPTLVRTGKLRATVAETFHLERGAAKVIVGNDAYIIKPENETISINGTHSPVDKPFELSNITFHFVNVTGPSINLEADLYGNDDVIANPASQIIVRTEPRSGVYFYYVGVSVVPEVNERLTNIIKKAESIFVPGGGSVLNARLNYYVDRETVSSLPIPVELIGTQINAISGVGKTSDEAYSLGRSVYAAIRFGALPSDLKYDSKTVSEPSISKMFSYATLGVGIVSSLIVLSLTFFKTKKPKVVFWIFVFVLIDVITSIGLLVAATKYLGMRFLIDYPVLIGISMLAIYLSLTFFVYYEALEGRHKHITIGYKKIMSLMNFLRIIMVAAIVIGIIGYRSMAFVLLVGFILDSLISKYLFKTLTTTGF